MFYTAVQNACLDTLSFSLSVRRNVWNPTPAGEHIEVTVASVKGGQMRIGIEASKEVTVLREGLLESEAARLTSPSG